MNLSFNASNAYNYMNTRFQHLSCKKVKDTVVFTSNNKVKAIHENNILSIDDSVKAKLKQKTMTMAGSRQIA